MIRRPLLLCLVLLVSSLMACSSSPEERLLKKAYSAIQENDWDNYSKLTITSVDFILKQYDVSALQARKSYTGSQMKPQELERHRNRFEEIQGAGAGFIDFAAAKFVSMGSVVQTGMYPLVLGGEVPYTAYSLRIRENGEEIDTKEMYPYFVVVKWNNEPRILYLKIDE